MKGINSLLMLLILAALFSCGGKRVAERSDLVRADSLMWICPDSSLAILREVNPAELDEANRAYYALLMTQALVRKEQSPTSDSLISIAFDYYRDNHNRERLTRTLIYMGACCDLVAETPDYMKALKYYLAAEKNADTADYVNLAQINMRIGYLYNSKIANDEEEIARFRKSLYYYTILDHKRQMGVSEGNIASAFRKICPDSAYYHYEKALGLLAEAGDMRMYWYYKGQLARAYEIGEDYRTAIAIARECLGKYGDEQNESLYDLAECYARIRMLDSAEYFLSLADTSDITPRERVSRYVAIEQIAWLRGDTAEYRKYNQLSRSFARKHVRTNHDSEIFAEESKFKIENLNEQNISLSNRNNLLLVLAMILLLILAAVVLAVVMRRRELMEAREMVRALQREKSLKPDEQISMNLKDPRLIEHISRQISMIQEFADLSFEGSIYPKNFLEKFRKLMKISRPSESFWPDLKAYVNETHDGLIDRITSQCELTEPEVNLICMETLGFSNVQEMVCLGYTNTNSITNKKKKVAQKLGAKLSLKKYIEFELKKTES